MTGAAPARALRAALCVALLAAPAAGAQRAPAELQGGVALATPLLVDGNGTRVRLGPALVAGVALAPARWRLGAGRLGVEARAATAAVRLDDGGARWSGGRAWQGELLATGTLARRARALPHLGVGIAWIGGGDGVRLLSDLARRPRPVVEGGLVLRRAATSPTSIAVIAQGLRVAPAGGEAGGVLRVLVTVRHAW